MSNFANVESPLNYEQKCLCVLLLDTSGSMKGTPINDLNNALKIFQSEILSDVNASNRLELCIIEFNDNSRVIQEPNLIGEVVMPTLTAGGLTNLLEGVKTAIKKVNERKNWYKGTGQKYYRPWIMMISDGAPTNSEFELKELTTEINEGVDNKNFLFFPIMVDGAALDVIQRISHPSTPPMPLNPEKFKELFVWLSASMASVANSKEGQALQLPAATSWAQITV